MEGSNTAQDILQAALDQAFSPPPSRRQSVRIASLETPSFSETAEEIETATNPAPQSPPEDSWKVEYEAQVEAWRAQSSQAREKAEKERQRWEAFRAAGGVETESHRTSDASETTHVEHEHEPEWERVSNKKEAEPEPSALEQVPSAQSNTNITATSLSPPPEDPAQPLSQTDAGEESQRWSEIHSSVTSSFPSMTYPEHIEAPSHQHPQPVSAPALGSLSATLAIFDSSLSTRTRVAALFSSLTINLLLPFVNGVMLGLGEIFAKDFVMDWLGWKPSSPGSIAASTGIGISARTRLASRERLEPEHS